jgi:hypothetical protein
MSKNAQSEKLALLLSMFEKLDATNAGDLAASVAAAKAVLAEVNKPKFDVAVTSFDDKNGKPVFMLQISGDGFKAKSLSPNIVAAMLAHTAQLADGVEMARRMSSGE